MKKITTLLITLVALSGCRVSSQFVCEGLIHQRDRLIQGQTNHNDRVEQEMLNQTDSLIRQVCDSHKTYRYED